MRKTVTALSGPVAALARMTATTVATALDSLACRHAKGTGTGSLSAGKRHENDLLTRLAYMPWTD